MFREKALEKLRSPEQLDEPVLTIRRLDKVASSALTYLLSFFFLWTLFLCAASPIFLRRLGCFPGADFASKRSHLA